MRYPQVNAIVLAIAILCINNSDSESVKETILQQINSNGALKTRNDDRGGEVVAAAKAHLGDNVKIMNDNITDQKEGTTNILGQETIGKRTLNLPARRNKRDTLREWKKKLLSGYKKIANETKTLTARQRKLQRRKQKLKRTNYPKLTQPTKSTKLPKPDKGQDNDRDTDRDIDRETDGDTDHNTDRNKYRNTDPNKSRNTDRNKEGKIDRNTDPNKSRNTDLNKSRNTDHNKDRNKYRNTDRKKKRNKELKKDRNKERKRDRNTDHKGRFKITIIISNDSKSKDKKLFSGYRQPLLSSHSISQILTEIKKKLYQRVWEPSPVSSLKRHKKPSYLSESSEEY